MTVYSDRARTRKLHVHEKKVADPSSKWLDGFFRERERLQGPRPILFSKLEGDAQFAEDLDREDPKGVEHHKDDQRTASPDARLGKVMFPVAAHPEHQSR